MDAIAAHRPALLSRLIWLPISAALLCFVYAVHISWHWPIVHDASIMHYVVFLMDHGMAPYRQINDINMPGAFIVEWLAMHLLGSSDLAWRIFDALSMLVAIGACCVITRSSDWRAGLLSGLLLAAAHMADGAIELGQRDWTLLVLVLAGYAFLYLAMERNQPAWMALFAFACGGASMVKPLALPLPFVLLTMSLVLLRKQRQNQWPFVAWSLTGAVAATAVFFAFLARYHATTAFFEMVRGLLPFYARLGNHSYWLMTRLIGIVVMAWLLIAAGLSIAMDSRREPQYRFVIVGIGFGAFFYFGQHKGFDQHKLTLLAFILLLVCSQAFLAVKQTGVIRIAGIMTLCFVLAYSVFHWTLATQQNSFDGRMLAALQHDLERQGGSSLSGNVQCIETATGCINDLYRMRLVQSTGFLSDIFLMTDQRVPALELLKARMLGELTARPPRVIVIEAAAFTAEPPHYEPLDDWPAFSAWLHQHYTLVNEHTAADGTIQRGSYRLYRLK